MSKAGMVPKLHPTQRCVLIILLMLGLVTQGCSVLKYADGSSQDEMAKLKMGKDEMWNEMKRLQAENENLGKQIDAMRAEHREKMVNSEKQVEKSKKQIKFMGNKNELLTRQIDRLQDENRRFIEEYQVLAQKMADPRDKAQTNGSPSKGAGKPLRDNLKIKILTGDGNLNSAKEVAKKLGTEGYKIKSIGFAPRSDFSKDVVFFAPKFRQAAKALASSIGDNTRSKSLTWPSVFDLIVVTGKKP